MEHGNDGLVHEVARALERRANVPFDEGDGGIYLRGLADRVRRDLVELPRCADGRRVRIGERLYAESGDSNVVWSLELVRRNRKCVWVLHMNGSPSYAFEDPMLLYHERPDSLARIADELDEHAKALSKKGCMVPDGMCSLSDLAARIRRMTQKGTGEE